MKQPSYSSTDLRGRVGEMRLPGLAKVLIAVLITADAASPVQPFAHDHGTDTVEFACPPDDRMPPEWARPTSPECGEFTATAAFVALLTGILGFVLGRASVPAPRVPTRDQTDKAIDKEAADRIDEARKSVPAAVPLLEQLRDRAQAAIRDLL
jgi:hypothetical protein